MAIEDIIVVHDFISDEENNKIIEYQKYLDKNNLWDAGNIKVDTKRQWADRYLGVASLSRKDIGFGSEYDFEMLNLLVDIRKRIKSRILETYNIDRIYADSLNLIKWPHGYVQPAHADDENFGGEPHIYNWRQIGCVLYLNDDFDGGEIHFPQHGVTIEVKPKMLAFFPGDINHAHGVNRVLNGTRYTVSTFWTNYEKHKDSLEQ